LTKNWVPHDVRDQVVDFVRRWSEKTEIGVGRFPQWLGIGVSKFYDWRQRYGRVNEHNGWIPRDFLAGAVGEGSDHRLPLESVEGYRRLTFMMLERFWVRSRSHQVFLRLCNLFICLYVYKVYKSNRGLLLRFGVKWPAERLVRSR
jgi:hypothetical protein